MTGTADLFNGLDISCSSTLDIGPLVPCKTGKSRPTAIGQSVVLGLDASNVGLALSCPSTLERTDISDSGMTLVLDDWTVFEGNGRIASHRQ